MVRKVWDHKNVFTSLLLFYSWDSCRAAASDISMRMLPSRVPKIPSPIVFSPSQDWEGNDGPWSSFTLQVGTPPQNLRVLIATSAIQTWLILPQGCTSTDPSNCGDMRGGIFTINASSTWEPNLTNPSVPYFQLELEQNLGYTGNGQYGFDDITLGWQGSGGPSLKNQTIAGIATKDFYLGVFGLTPRPSNFSGFNNPLPSFMENLRSQNLIPSTSWSYTAGNQYRTNKVLGSLTLGGYDSSKFISNNISWLFNEQDERDLSVAIDSITSVDSLSSTPTSLLPKSISSFLDSTVPHIWLPQEACTLFEQAFNLTYDNLTSLYLIDDTQHNNLLSQNANITFTLSNQKDAVNITLPYSAFDLVADYPIVSQPTRYFPLRRAANSTQYTLGRTFFQEAYRSPFAYSFVIADYDRRNFSVSQCNWDTTTNSQSNIVSIFAPANTTSTTPTPTSTPSTPSSSPSPHHVLTPKLKATIILIALIVFILSSLFLFNLYVLKPRRLRRRQLAEADAANTVGRVTNGDKDAIDEAVRRVELDSTREARELIGEGKGGIVNVHETDGTGVHEIDSPVPASEMGDREIFEMPAREEVAFEMMGASIGGEQKQSRARRMDTVSEDGDLDR